jgi:hypothetical protein
LRVPEIATKKLDVFERNGDKIKQNVREEKRKMAASWKYENNIRVIIIGGYQECKIFWWLKFDRNPACLFIDIFQVLLNLWGPPSQLDIFSTLGYSNMFAMQKRNI